MKNARRPSGVDVWHKAMVQCRSFDAVIPRYLLPEQYPIHRLADVVDFVARLLGTALSIFPQNSLAAGTVPAGRNVESCRPGSREEES